MKITFVGIPPSKKNCKRIVCRGRRPLVLPSKSYEERHKKTREYIHNQGECATTPSHVEYHFRIPYNKDGSISKRKFDFSNKIESINDFLVDQEIIEDDHYGIISTLSVTHQMVPYLQGEVDVTITKI